MSKTRKNPDRASKKKRKLNKKKNYTQEELVEAIRSIKCGELTTQLNPDDKYFSSRKKIGSIISALHI